MSNQIEQIRAEIERRIKELPECSTKTTAGAAAIRHRRIYESLLAFIDQLPTKENPILIPADIQEAADKYIGHPYEVDEGVEVSMRRNAFARGMMAQNEKIAAYIRECLEPEESLFNACPEDYTKGKIRGYKDILSDLENGALDRYMDKKSANEKAELTCRTCAHRERWQMGGSVIQYCGARRSSRTQNGLRKIKVTDKACALYKEDKK